MQKPNPSDVAIFFNAAYSSQERYWWKHEWRHSADPENHKLSPLNKIALSKIINHQNGVALDIGAGEGADAIRIAKTGLWEVDCIDISNVACEKIEKFAKHENIKLNIINSDFFDYEPKRTYDLILLQGVGHYLDKITTLMSRLEPLLSEGGYVMFSSFTSHTPLPEQHSEIGAYLSPQNSIDELQRTGWIGEVWYEIAKAEQSHDGMKPHVHSHIKGLVSKQPNSGDGNLCGK